MSSSNGSMTIIEDDESQLAGLVRPEASVGTAIQLMAVMVDKRITTARQFPRSIARFKQEAGDLLKEDIETARSAEYAKPVGGGTVKGPSIRLAELAAMCWTNLEIEVGEPVVGDKSVFVKATAWDLQRNYRQDGTASASIVGKHGRYPAHLIETTCAATASKAKRNAIIAVIPRAYINDLLEIAKKIAAGKEMPLEQRRKNALESFAVAYKVEAARIFTHFEVSGIDDLTGEHLDELNIIRTSIKEGEAKIEEFFPIPTESKTEALKQKIEDRKKGKDTPKEEKKPDAEPDQLAERITEFTRRGGDLMEFIGKNGLKEFDDLTNSTGETRAKLSRALFQELRTLPEKK